MENGTLSNVSLSTIWWLNFWTWNSLVIGCWPVMSCLINEWPLWHAATVHCFLKWQPCHFPVMAQCFVVLIYLNVSQKRCWLFYPLFQFIFLFYWGWPSFGFKQFMMLFTLLRVLVTWGPHCSLESKTIPSTLIWFLVSILRPETLIINWGESDHEKRQISVFDPLTFSPDLANQLQMFPREISSSFFMVCRLEFHLMV